MIGNSNMTGTQSSSLRVVELFPCDLWIPKDAKYFSCLETKTEVSDWNTCNIA